MALTTIDPTSALVVIDLQKGIFSTHTEGAVNAVVKQAAHLAAEFRRHSLPVVLVTVAGRAPGRTEADRAGGGLESTARSTYDYGYHVVVATDAVSDPNADAHCYSIERVFPKIGETATTSEVIDMVDATRIEATR